MEDRKIFLYFRQCKRKRLEKEILTAKQPIKIMQANINFNDNAVKFEVCKISRFIFRHFYSI